MVLVKPPAKPLVSWPPIGHVKAHPIKDKENWWRLADRYHRKDPWDIIKFNFATDDPKEVNWFLQELVGCTKSKDGLNYSFSSSDKPGLVYIPPDTWKPSAGPIKPSPPPPPGGPLTPEDEVARRSVLNVLADPKLSRIDFTYRSYRVNWRLLIAVANRIIDRIIDVRYDSTLKNAAEYDYGDDVMFLRFKSGLSETQRALVVHEAVHAGLDVKKAGDLDGSEAEAAAYLAQAIYAMAIFPPGDVLIDSDAFMQAIFDRAWHVAEQLAAGKKFSELSLEMYALESAVASSPKYKKTAGKPSGYDGVK